MVLRLEAAHADPRQEGRRGAIERELVAVQEAAVLEEEPEPVWKSKRDVAGFGGYQKDAALLQHDRVAALADLRRIGLGEDPLPAAFL